MGEKGVAEKLSSADTRMNTYKISGWKTRPARQNKIIHSLEVIRFTALMVKAGSSSVLT